MRKPAHIIAGGALRLRRLGRAIGRGMTRGGLRPLPTLLSLSLGVFLAGYFRYVVRLEALWALLWETETEEVTREALIAQGIPELLIVSLVICGVLCLSLLVGMVIGRRQLPSVLSYLRKCYIIAYAILAVTAFAVFRVIGLFAEFKLHVLGEQFDKIVAFYWRWELLWPLGVLFIFVAIMHLISWRRLVINLYHGESATEPAIGDEVIESVRSDGKDPVYRRSTYGSLLAHFLVIIAIPWLMQLQGCIEPYQIPKGSGNPAVTLVTMVKPPQKEKQKLILSSESAIIYEVPDLDQSEVEKQVDQATQQRYVADSSSVHGAGGQPGQGPGWPDGMEGARVRFVRLQYQGADWDGGMDARHRADMNFLEAFHARTGFRIADRSEAITPSQLDGMPKGQQPPFLYMTGTAGISMGASDRRILREYLLEAGLLFADASSPQWDRSFRAFMASLFPDKPLIVIADDDPIYSFPFQMAGAPPLWHHGGMKSMGIKHRGRFIVYYHPGDLRDAWQTGHSGISPALAEAAYDLGVNIVYYSFTNYLQETRKYRK